MRIVVALLLALVVAVPALAEEPEPYVRTCSTSQFGDLGRGWRERAVVAGPLAFVGVRNGLASSRWPHKILVVVEPNRVATVTIAARSRAYAALGYNGIRHNGTGVPLADGTQSVRFQACHPRPLPGALEPRHAVRRLLPRRRRALRAHRGRDSGSSAAPQAQLRRPLRLAAATARRR